MGSNGLRGVRGFGWRTGKGAAGQGNDPSPGMDVTDHTSYIAWPVY